MSTEARINANRLNAQKSTGPKTPKGKAAIAQNALKHGLSANHDVIITETQEDFDLHRQALIAELAPQTQRKWTTLTKTSEVQQRLLSILRMENEECAVLG